MVKEMAHDRKLLHRTLGLQVHGLEFSPLPFNRATEAENLCYMTRLGLWGPGSAFT